MPGTARLISHFIFSLKENLPEVRILYDPRGLSCNIYLPQCAVFIHQYSRWVILMWALKFKYICKPFRKIYPSLLSMQNAGTWNKTQISANFKSGTCRITSGARETPTQRGASTQSRTYCTTVDAGVAGHLSPSRRVRIVIWLPGERGFTNGFQEVVRKYDQIHRKEHTVCDDTGENRIISLDCSHFSAPLYRQSRSLSTRLGWLRYWLAKWAIGMHLHHL